MSPESVTPAMSPKTERQRSADSVSPMAAGDLEPLQQEHDRHQEAEGREEHRERSRSRPSNYKQLQLDDRI